MHTHTYACTHARTHTLWLGIVCVACSQLLEEWKDRPPVVELLPATAVMNASIHSTDTSFETSKDSSAFMTDLQDALPPETDAQAAVQQPQQQLPQSPLQPQHQQQQPQQPVSPLSSLLSGLYSPSHPGSAFAPAMSPSLESLAGLGDGLQMGDSPLFEQDVDDMLRATHDQLELDTLQLSGTHQRHSHHHQQQQEQRHQQQQQQQQHQQHQQQQQHPHRHGMPHHSLTQPLRVASPRVVLSPFSEPSEVVAWLNANDFAEDVARQLSKYTGW